MADDQNNGNKDPWGRPQKGQSPPELGEIFKKLTGGFSGKKGDAKGSGSNSGSMGGFGVGVIVVVLIVIWALSGIFIVSPAERAVVLQFGKYDSTLGPGPHWIPRFIQSDYVVNVQQVSNFTSTAEMLTKDENIVSVSLAVQYRVDDANKYLFNVVAPVASLKQATASALRQVIGRTTLDDILTTGRQQVREQVAIQLKKILARYDTGILVTDVTLQPAKPPEQVTSAFDDAIKAREDEQRYINQAQAYAKKVVPIAQGQVSRVLQEASAFEQQVVLNAKANVASYLAILPEYKLAPTVTRERMYLDTMQSVFSHTSKILVDAKGGQSLFYLPLDQLLKQAEKANTQQTKNALPSTHINTSVTTSMPLTDLGQPYSRPNYPTRGGE